MVFTLTKWLYTDETSVLLRYYTASLGVCCIMFWDCVAVSSWRDHSPLKMRPLHHLETMGNECPVTEHIIHEEMSSQLHCFESLKTHNTFFLIIEGGFSCSSKVVLARAHDLRPNFILCLFHKDRNKIQGSYGQLLWSLMLNTKIPFVKTLHSTPAN